MLSHLKSIFKKAPEKPFYPEVFNHPLALKVSWKPQKRGGSNFKNVKLVTKDSRTLMYVPTTLSYVLSGLFLFAPLLYFSIFYLTDSKGVVAQFLEFPFVLIIPIFIGVALFMAHKTLKPHGFSQQLGYHYKSFKKPTSQ